MKKNEIYDTSVRTQFWIQTLIYNEDLRKCKNVREAERFIMNNIRHMEEGFTPLDKQCFIHAVEALPVRYKTSIKV